MEEQDNGFEFTISERLKHMGYKYDLLEKNIKNYLFKIEKEVSEVFRREEEAIEIVRHNSININNIAKNTGISRQSIYNHNLLKEYIDYCAKEFGHIDVYVEIERLQKLNREYRQEIDCLHRRDVEFMELKRELKSALKEISDLKAEQDNIYSFNDKKERAEKNVKIISWNVNGLNACLKKGFNEYFDQWNADIVCLQETRMKKTDNDIALKGYYQYWNHSLQPGYAGVAVFSKINALSVHYGIDDLSGDDGRVIVIEYEDYFLVNVYAPNPLGEPEKILARINWNKSFISLLRSLVRQKEVIVCGDLNVDVDRIGREDQQSVQEEYEIIYEMMHMGFLDVYKCKYPNRHGEYSWKSNYGGVSKKRLRIDYFWSMRKLVSKINNIRYLIDVNASDHIPIELEIFL